MTRPLLAAAFALLSGVPVPIAAQAAPVDSVRMLRVLGALAHDSMEGRGFGTEGGARARALLVDELRARGIAPLVRDYVQPLALRATSGRERHGGNVLAVVPGARVPDRYLVISAHYDHIGTRGGVIFNGADDNASGVAVALELASALAARPLAHSVILAFVDGEEAGLRGTRAFLEAELVPDSAIVLNVNLDMVGRNDRCELWVAGTHHYPQLRELVAGVAARSELIVRAGHDTGSGRDDWTGASDHAVFHARGIPFLYFGVEDHADYHRPSDDPDGIQPGFITRAARTVLDAVRSADEWLVAPGPSDRSPTLPTGSSGCGGQASSRSNTMTSSSTGR